MIDDIDKIAEKIKQLEDKVKNNSIKVNVNDIEDAEKLVRKLKEKLVKIAEYSYRSATGEKNMNFIKNTKNSQWKTLEICLMN